MSPVPAVLQGAWRRVALALDGGPPTEPAQVIWVQAGAAYADVRVPVGSGPGCSTGAASVRSGEPVGSDAMSFAGTAFWDAPYLTWVHELDSELPGESAVAAGAHGDRGRIGWNGEDLIETGTLVQAGSTVPYTEVWRRLTRPEEPVLALAAADGSGRLVRVGDHALTVIDERTSAARGGGGAYRAVYRVRRGDGWPTVLSFGPRADDLPLPPDAPPPSGGLSGTQQLSLDGRPWRVLEHR